MPLSSSGVYREKFQRIAAAQLDLLQSLNAVVPNTPPNVAHKALDILRERVIDAAAIAQYIASKEQEALDALREIETEREALRVRGQG